MPGRRGTVIVGRMHWARSAVLDRLTAELHAANLTTVEVVLDSGRLPTMTPRVLDAAARIRRAHGADETIAFLGAGRAATAGWHAASLDGVDAVMAWNPRPRHASVRGRMGAPSLLLTDGSWWRGVAAERTARRIDGRVDIARASVDALLLGGWFDYRLHGGSPVAALRRPVPLARRRVVAAAAGVAAGVITLPLTASGGGILPDFSAGARLAAADINGDSQPTASSTSERENNLKSGEIKGDGTIGDPPLTDGGGLRWNVNTNVGFQTSSSASGAVSEAGWPPGNPRAATTLNGGTVNQTLGDAFDGYNALCLDVNNAGGQCNTANMSVYNLNGPAALECSGRQVVLPLKTMGSLNVRRKVFVPSNDSFARWLNFFTNTSASAVTVRMQTSNNLGSDAGTRIVTTSDGDATPELTDTWITTFQNYSGTTSADVRLGHVLQGVGSPAVGLAALSFVNGDDNPYWRYVFTLNPGETAIIMNFATGQPTKAAAATKAASLADLSNANALACMASSEIGQVKNFATGATPTDIALSNNTVAENQPSGTAVGTLSTTDADAGDSFTYTLVSGTGSDDNGSFQIVGDQLQTNASFDFETKSSYTVRVRTTDTNGHFFEEPFTITVTNVNEAPTNIALSNNSVPENQPAGTAVGNFSSTDPDAGDTHTYTLVSGTGSTNNASFQIVGNQLRTNAAFNFETKSSYSIRVRTTDANGLFFEKVFTISVTNVNEAPTNISLSNNTVPENQPSGTAVGNFSSTDPDAGDTHTYTLVSGTGSTDNASFQIVGNQLRTNAAFNFESKSSYSVRVRSTDANGLFFEKAFTITITNVNEAPTNISLSNNTVPENQPSGTAVGNFSSTDPDAGDTQTYTLVSGTGSTDNASFQIVGNQLRTNAAFNFESKSSYSVRVRSTDANGLFFEKAFTITITNVNEAPTNIALSNNSVPENQPSGTAVGNFSSTDPDAGDTQTYTLVSGTGSTDNASFQIVGNQLRTNAAFNFESKSSYSIRVRTTDANGLFFEKAFTITITNVNEAPTNIALSNNSVPENQPAGTAVGNFSSTDPDAGDTFTYTLVSGTGSTNNASFQIVGNQLRTNAAFNFESKSSYSIRVRTTDANGLFFEKVFTISVTNVNEAPTNIALSNTTVPENQSTGTAVGNFSTTDPDAGNTHTYSLVSGTGSTDNASFQIVGNQLRTNASFNFEGKKSYAIRVRTTDNNGLFFEKVFTISVTNVNEAPTDIALSNNTVDENQPTGTTVGTLSTTDPDAGDTHIYTLVSGTGSTDNASFQIVGNELRTNAVFDFETKSAYSVRVRTTDANGLFYEEAFAITINDLDELPPQVRLSRADRCDADGEVGVFVVKVSDPDTPLGSLIVSANSSDANVANASVVDLGGGVYEVRIDATGLAAGAADVTVSVSDGSRSDAVTIHVQTGTDARDVLDGGTGADLLLGRGGSDTLRGDGGKDLLCGGAGFDGLEGGDGADVLDGGTESDWLQGGDGNDVLRGGDGSDQMYGDAGKDSFSGGGGFDNAADFNAGEGDTKDATTP